MKPVHHLFSLGESRQERPQLGDDFLGFGSAVALGPEQLFSGGREDGHGGHFFDAVFFFRRQKLSKEVEGFE